MSPFFANYGYHPRCKVTVSTESSNPAAENFVDTIHAIHAELKEHLQSAQERYKENHDRHTRPAPEFAVGDKVWLMRRNIRTTRPSQKLNVKRMGPFKIVKVVGDEKLAYRLELPKRMGRIHSVFHVSLLEPYHENQWAGRVQEPPPPEEIEGELEYEVKEILDSKVVRGRLKYLVEWVGYGPEECTWESAEDVENARGLVASFHLAHPNRPSSDDLPQRRRAPPRRR
jgi:hypothetical protein